MEIAEVYNIKERKARKDHKCYATGAIIKKGEVYSYHSGIFDGEPFSAKYLKSWVEFIDECNKQVDFEDNLAYESDWQDADWSKEDCLKALKAIGQPCHGYRFFLRRLDVLKMQRLEKELEEEQQLYMRSLSLIYDIRAAIGDKEGRLMQDELVKECKILFDKAQKFDILKRKPWKIFSLMKES